MKAAGPLPDRVADETPVPDEWVRALSGGEVERERATARLHEMLLRVARAETRRRGGQLRISGPELDDLAHQAAADAVLAIIAKIGEFRGESRFTTWACKFVIFEVSGKIGRHFWRHPAVPLEVGDWDRLPDRLGLDPARESEWRDLARALRHAVEEELTEHQRQVFTKGALEHFTAVAALEFGGRGITVNAVSPGATETEGLRAANPGETFEDEVARTALKRLGQPEDIAAVVASLAGPDSAWITGQVLRADGGFLP